VLVSDVMTTDVPRVSTSASLREAIGAMIDHDVETVFVRREHPAGLVTLGDALFAVYQADAPPSEIPMEQFATGFSETVTPGTTVLFAIAHMVRKRCAVLPVVDGVDVFGVVTQTDVIEHSSSLTKEMISNATHQRKWER
jgi:CBS domain-containing protein